jgi:hypothetical protein
MMIGLTKFIVGSDGELMWQRQRNIGFRLYLEGWISWMAAPHPAPILSQINPVHTTPFYLSKIHFNIIRSYVLIFLVACFVVTFSPMTYSYMHSSLLIRVSCLSHFILLHLVIQFLFVLDFVSNLLEEAVGISDSTKSYHCLTVNNELERSQMKASRATWFLLVLVLPCRRTQYFPLKCNKVLPDYKVSRPRRYSWGIHW